MKKIEYPSDRPNLEKEYKQLFDITKNDWENKWKKLKLKHPNLNIFSQKIEDILVAEYSDLVKMYIDYCKAISPSENEEIKQQLGLLKKKSKKKKGKKPIKKIRVLKSIAGLFNYSKYEGKIRSFFADSRNGIKIDICHYCETAYINLFEEKKEDSQLGILNYYSKDYIKSLLNKGKEYLVDKIIDKRPYDSIKNFSSGTGIDVDSTFTKSYINNGGDYLQYDIDHVLDKGRCPLIAWSLYNFVPSCQICNSRIKHIGVLGCDGIPSVKLSPTSTKYDFDKSVKIELHSNTGNINTDPLSASKEYYLVFKTDDLDYKYEIYFFKLEQRYNYHIAEALRLLDLKQKYPKSNILSIASITGKSEDEVYEDIFGEQFTEKENRCFQKLKRDIMKQLCSVHDAVIYP